LEFRQIRYALAVAKERSFTKAAERLSISQSAVSEQVKLLEEEVGFPLFRRGPRGIDMTERGRTFLYEAERIVGDVLSLADTARRLRGAVLDTFKIGMGSGMAQIFMPRLFENLEEIMPGVQLEIFTEPTRSIFNDLHDERIDAGLALESDPDRVPAGLVFDRLTSIEMALIVHPKHALARARQPVDVGRLVAEPIVMNELWTRGDVAVRRSGHAPQYSGDRQQYRNHEVDRAIGQRHRHRSAPLRRQRGRARRAQGVAHRAGTQHCTRAFPAP
jgi:DNA-binding transcriptional LysR family regulator